MLVEVGAQNGSYSGSPAARWVDIHIHNVFAPVAATRLFPASGRCAVKTDISQL